MVELFANRGEPDQMPHSAVADLGLHCLPDILLGVFRLQWVNSLFMIAFPLQYKTRHNDIIAITQHTNKEEMQRRSHQN